MTRDEVFDILNEIFRNIFEDDSIDICDSTTSADIEEWDSLAQMNLVSAVEQEFGIQFDAAQAADIRDVGELADLILAAHMPV